MANIKYFVNNGAKHRAINLRLYEGKGLDLCTKTGLSVLFKNWDPKKQRIRNVIEVTDRDKINEKLATLEAHTISQFNLAFSEGEIIDREWLKNTVHNFFNRPAGEVKLKNDPVRIYLSDYIEWWLNNIAPKWKVSASKYMSETTIRQYRQALKNLNEYQGRSKVKFTELNDLWFDGLSKYLTTERKYTAETATAKIKKIKFFCQRAEADNIAIDKKYKERVFVEEATGGDYKHPYLNWYEINDIYKLDLSHDTKLDHARDYLIIGCCTGLRISDFLTRLSMDNIEGDFIKIKTKKTGHDVAIPLHKMVKSILSKYNGLPPKMAEPVFNKQIKIVAQLAEIDNEIMGGIVTKDEKYKKDKSVKPRKVVGLYKKYLLVSSHICRRSFATNHFNKLPNSVIMAICGWKTEHMMLNYIKETNMESAKLTKEYWEKAL